MALDLSGDALPPKPGIFVALYPLQRSQNFFRVAFGFHVVENLRDLAVFDNERGTRDAHHHLAVHVLFLHHSVLVGDVLVGVGEQREVEFELLFEFCLSFGGVG